MKLRLLAFLGALLLCSFTWGSINNTGSVTITTAGTAVQLSAAGSPAPPTTCQSLTITAFVTNVGTIYIGGSNVSASNHIGAYINSSFPSAYFAPGVTYTPTGIWFDATNSGDKVSYACLR